MIYWEFIYVVICWSTSSESFEISQRSVNASTASNLFHSASTTAAQLRCVADHLFLVYPASVTPYREVDTDLLRPVSARSPSESTADVCETLLLSRIKISPSKLPGNLTRSASHLAYLRANTLRLSWRPLSDRETSGSPFDLFLTATERIQAVAVTEYVDCIYYNSCYQRISA